MFSHFAAGICATKSSFSFESFFFEMAEMEDSAFFLLELFIQRLDFNCYLVLFQIGMANKETNLELSVLRSLSCALYDEADKARRKGCSRKISVTTNLHRGFILCS